MLEKYKTILHRGESEIIEKKSKFIASVNPVENEEQAQDFINEIRKKYSNANHNIFAYQIGEKNEIQRYSDDKEPSGTAGIPVLDILKKENIKNVVVVVTRYFGGTLLGTGGLVRVYSKCAKQGLVSAIIIERVLHQSFEVCVNYNLSKKVEYEILNKNFIIKDILYSDKVTFIVLVLLNQSYDFEKFITNITNAQVKITKTNKIYKDII